MRLRFHTDGRVVHTRFVPRREYVGFRTIIHGGLVATLLDEIMVWACVVQTRRFAFAAEMTVRYVLPVKPGEEVVATGELVSNRRHRLFEAKAEMRSAHGVLLASSTGKYIPLKEGETREMSGDFIGDPIWITPEGN
jgi:uncharacterized protein (TIGR00369 family)